MLHIKLRCVDQKSVLIITIKNSPCSRQTLSSRVCILSWNAPQNSLDCEDSVFYDVWRFDSIFTNFAIISSLLRRGLLQSRWVETRGGWEQGKIKARGERWEGERSLRSRFLSLALPLLSYLFHWCLLTGASAEERESLASRWTVNGK